MKTSIINPITDMRWDSFINNQDHATIFHTSAWAKVLQDRYQTPPTYWILENENGGIVAAAPFFIIDSFITGKKLLCLPGSEYCFPLVNKGVDITNLINSVKNEVSQSGISYLEIRGWEDFSSPERMGLKKYGYFLNHKLELDSDPEKIKERFIGRKYKHMRNRINRVEKSSFNLKEAQDEKDLKKFYHLYTHHRKRLGLLPEPYKYFKSIFDNIILHGYGFIYLAEKNDRLIAGDINFSFGNILLAKFGASDKKYLQTKVGDFLTWNAIKRACFEGRKYYDLGRTHPENQGLVRFKRGWSSIEKIQSYYYYPEKHKMSLVSTKNYIYRTYNIINKVMPDFCAKIAGSILSKHIA